MTIYILRGAYANQFELQNYDSLLSKYDIQVITSRHPLTRINLPATALWSPSDLPHFPYRKQILNRLIGGEQWLLGLANVITKGSIVHTAETYTPYTHQAVRLRKSGHIAKLICTCWETIPHNNEKFLRLQKWKKEAYAYVDLFHTPTERAKQALVVEGVDPHKIVVIPCGVNRETFHPANNWGHRKRLRILTVARLVPEKGLSTIEYCARSLPSVDFVVVGSGAWTPACANITIHHVDYQEMPAIYRSADIFLLPSTQTSTWEEQYGMALIEAMASGLPVVSSQSGAIPEVLGSAGVIVQGSGDDYITALNKLLRSSANRAKYSKKSINRARFFERASQDLISLYD